MRGSVVQVLEPVSRRRSGGQDGPRPIGEILVEMGELERETLGWALDRQARHHAPVGEILRAHGLVGEDALYDALARQFSTPVLDPPRIHADPSMIDALGLAFCAGERVLPMGRVGQVTVVATSRPHKFTSLRPILNDTLGPTVMALVRESDFETALVNARRHALVRRAETRPVAEQSCRDFSIARSARLWVPVASLAAATALWPGAVFDLLAVVALASLLAHTLFQAAVLIFALKKADDPTGEPPAIVRLPRVTLLVPLYAEKEIAGTLVERLSRLDYPRELLELCLITEQNDAITRAALMRADLPPWMRVVSVPPGRVMTKPRAMNYALDFCNGSLIGIYDAEDEPPPDQIRKMVDAFHRSPPEVACLQGRLNFYNTSKSLITRCFAIEYSTWFGLSLPGLRRLGWPVPLGGTTLFFRRAVLEDLGAWDAHNVTEDADLGLRLVRRGYRTELLDSTTEEEATRSPVPWIRQRSRWLKGYFLTYLVHMRSPARLWSDLGPWGFLGMQVIFLGTVLNFALAPILWSFWLLALGLPHPWAAGLPLGASVALGTLLMGSSLIGAAVSAVALKRAGKARLCWFLPAMHPYFVMGCIAMFKALLETVCAPFFWDKTAHGHSTAPAASEPQRAPEAARMRGGDAA